MDIRKLLLIPHAITAFAIAVALTFPCVVEAVSIGEVVLQSRLGEPLLAQVDLTVGNGERIDDSCLSLAAPGADEEDTSGYLTKANLSLKTEGKRQYVAISSRSPFYDAFARLRLQVKCPGSGSVIKTLTILPDMDISVSQAPIAAPSTPPVAENTTPDTHGTAPVVSHRDIGEVQTNVQKHLADKAARPVHKRRPPPVRTAMEKHGGSESFRLKLSSEPIDESRIGKISAEERSLLLARQKMLDADDQMASFLSMQNQVKQLQDELGEIKSQLTKLGVSPAPAASSAIVAASTAVPSASLLATSGAQESSPRQTPAVKQPAVQQNILDLPNGLFAALGLVLAILALWLGLRYYTKVKSRAGFSSQQETSPILKVANDAATAPKMAVSTAAKPSQVASSQANVAAPSDVASPKSSPARSEAAAPFLSPAKKTDKEVTEEDSMMEEAELYATHGRPAKAAEILQEIIKRCPSKVNAWSLLLSIFSSLGKAAEFEKTAREFLNHHKDSPAWSGIQALGRTFDQNNPLYIDNSGSISASPILPDAANPRRPVGDVLIEMGVLSKQDLQNCLDDFDPKKHGRFGGYLVARKVITLAQLDQALLQQQGIRNEEKPGVLPSLQDMENFLADFDPKRDGSVGEFLASRNAATAEQLNQVLKQKTNPAATAKTAQADNPTSLEKEPKVDSGLNSSSIFPALNLEFEPATGKTKPLDFEVEPSAISFPEINLELGNDTPPEKKPGSQ